MSWTARIRQAHRWLAIAFTGGFVVNLVAIVTGGEPGQWMYMLAVIPLFLLLPTGLVMLVVFYASRRVGTRHAGG